MMRFRYRIHAANREHFGIARECDDREIRELWRELARPVTFFDEASPATFLAGEIRESFRKKRARLKPDTTYEGPTCEGRTCEGRTCEGRTHATTVGERCDMGESTTRSIGLGVVVAYAALIGWLYARQPQTIAQVTGGLSAVVG